MSKSSSSSSSSTNAQQQAVKEGGAVLSKREQLIHADNHTFMLNVASFCNVLDILANEHLHQLEVDSRTHKREESAKQVVMSFENNYNLGLRTTNLNLNVNVNK